MQFLRTMLLALLLLPLPLSAAQAKDMEEDRVEFPRMLQVSPYGGFTKLIPQIEIRNDGRYIGNKMLFITGVSVDVSVLQIRRFLWNHFQCYPQLGIEAYYGRLLSNKGNTAGLSIYLAPQHDCQAPVEFFPRLGVGVAYMHIPGFADVRTPQNEGQEGGNDVLPQIDVSDIPDFRSNVSLDLSLALVLKIRLSPYWTLCPIFGFHYIPQLSEEEQSATTTTRYNKDIKLTTGGLGLSYTFNPSVIRYASLGDLRWYRIDVGMMHGFRKYQPRPANADLLGQQVTPPTPQPQPQGGADPDATQDSKIGNYYYVGGLYALFSTRITESHALTASTEWLLDWASKEALEGLLKKHHLKIALLGGHEFLWGKAIFGQQVGGYIMNNASHEGNFFMRLGLDYRITDYLFVGAGFKANFDVKLLPFSNIIQSIRNDLGMTLETFDFRLGYSF